MKKKQWIVWVMTLLLCLSAFPVTAASTGDTNRDGAVDMMDALLLYVAASGEKTLSPSAVARGDVDRDGSITMQDALWMFASAGGQAVSMPTDVAYEAYYLQLPVRADASADTVLIASPEDWERFTSANEAVDPACYETVRWSPETQAVIALPVQTQAQVATVTTDATTLSVSLLMAVGDGADDSLFQRYAFVVVDLEELAGLSQINVMTYEDASDVSDLAWQATVNTPSERCQQMEPMTITDVQTLEEFVEQYYGRPLQEMSEFKLYDEQFFQYNILVWAGYTAPTAAHAMEILSCNVNDSAIYVHREVTVVPQNEAALTVVKEYPALLQLANFDYSGQKAVTIDHMRAGDKAETPIDYEVLFSNQMTCVSYGWHSTKSVSCEHGSGATEQIERIDSYEAFLEAVDADKAFGDWYADMADEAFFEDNVLLLLHTQDDYVLQTMDVRDAYRCDDVIVVERVYTYTGAVYRTNLHGCMLIRVAASDIDGVYAVDRVDVVKERTVDLEYDLLSISSRNSSETLGENKAYLYRTYEEWMAKDGNALTASNRVNEAFFEENVLLVIDQYFATEPLLLFTMKEAQRTGSTLMLKFNRVSIDGRSVSGPYYYERVLIALDAAKVGHPDGIRIVSQASDTTDIIPVI